MDWLSLFLIIFMIFYLIGYIKKTLDYIKEFENNKAKTDKITGTIIKCTNEKIMRIQDKAICIGYPIYECFIEGESKTLQGLVKYKNIVVGQKVKLLYYKEKDKLWCERDLMLMRKHVFMQVTIIIVLLLIMILESIFV